MKKIVLNVHDEHLSTVMQILTNLKTGLIESIEGEALKSTRHTAYAPKNGNIVSEGEKPRGKYASVATYKSRLKKG